MYKYYLAEEIPRLERGTSYNTINMVISDVFVLFLKMVDSESLV
jgi:hypothetical protein